MAILIGCIIIIDTMTRLLLCKSSHGEPPNTWKEASKTCPITYLCKPYFSNNWSILPVTLFIQRHAFETHVGYKWGLFDLFHILCWVYCALRRSSWTVLASNTIWYFVHIFDSLSLNIWKILPSVHFEFVIRITILYLTVTVYLLNAAINSK